MCPQFNIILNSVLSTSMQNQPREAHYEPQEDWSESVPCRHQHQLTLLHEREQESNCQSTSYLLSMCQTIVLSMNVLLSR